MHRSLIVVAVMAGPAAASPVTDAIAKHDDAAVSMLRTHLDASDATVRCALGVVYAKRGDLSRADLYLAGCDDAEVDEAITADVHAAIAETAKKIRDSDLSGIDIVANPPNVDAEIDELPGDHFTVPRQIWVPAGHHVVKVHVNGKEYQTAVDAKPHSRGPLIIDVAPATPKPTAPVDHVADFSDEGAKDAPTSGPPPNVKHPPMKVSILDKHQSEGGEQLEDPLVAHRATSTWRFGARLGGGVFTQTDGSARVGPAFAGLAALELTRSADLSFRLDWTRRGSDAADAIGLTVGPTFTVAALSSLSLRAGVGARADVRVDSTSDDMGRANLHGAAWLEAPLRSVPLTVALRYEHAATSLADGVRDQAAIIEVGWDLR